MLVFEPLNKTGDYECLSYTSLWTRVEGNELAPRPSQLIHDSLASGALSSYVQTEGGAVFYRVPKEHWNKRGAWEGKPSDGLFCFNGSDVPCQFHDKPLLFFLDEVEKWERNLGRTSLPDEAINPPSLAELIDSGTVPVEGYWDYFTALAWVITRSEGATAGIQSFSERNHANRGSVFAGGVSLCLADECAARGWMTAGNAERELRLALQAGRIPGGNAKNRVTARQELIERHQWLQWNLAFENFGISLLPGYVDFAWPSEEVRLAFPVPEPQQEISPSVAQQLECGPEPGHWMSRKLSPEQRNLAEFFEAAEKPRAGESEPLPTTALHAKYITWLAAKKSNAPPLERTAFTKWLKRWQQGYRPKDRYAGWKWQDPDQIQGPD